MLKRARKPWGQLSDKPVLVHSGGDGWQVMQKTGARAAGSGPQGSRPAKPLMEKAKIALSPEIPVLYYDYQV
jgi:hypothetical protein